MTLNPYLNFNGDAEAAANLYAGLLGGRIESLHHYSDMPPMAGFPPTPAEWMGKVMHCTMTYPGGSLSMADVPPSHPAVQGNSIVLTLSCDNAEQAQKAWNVLSDGAQKVSYPLGEAFFAKLYGELVDRFGMSWAIMFEE